MNESETHRWHRLKGLFHEAVEAAASERERLVAEVRAGDPETARELERLLVADAIDASDTPDARSVASEVEPSLVGRDAGPWRLTKQVGVGATSAVYLAERSSKVDGAETDGPVAIKVLHRGLASGQVLRRFERERRTLASLRHRNVVALHGAVTLDDGTPCLVMEAVDGEHLDVVARRCDTVRDVLDLFLQVCAAVSHAHENLLVHRDIKPSNVRVLPGGCVKVLDFGVVKLLTPRADEVETDPGWIAPLTPRYASPEQWGGGAITTKSDVFSLGVLLAELVERFDCAPGGDLALIASTASASDPSLRYASVDRLVDDIERHLEGLPLRASRPSPWDATRRFVRRHRWGVGGAALLLVLLAGGLAFLHTQWRRTQHAESVAWRAHAQALSVSSLYEGLLDASDLGRLERDPGFLEALDAAASDVGERFRDLPEAEGRARASIARLYLRLGRHDEALIHARRSVAIAEEAVGFGERDRNALRALVSRIEDARAGG